MAILTVEKVRARLDELGIENTFSFDLISQLSSEFGKSKRTIYTKLRILGVKYAAKKVSIVRYCYSCEKQLEGNQRKYCDSCKFVEYPCSICGKTSKEYVSQYRHRNEGRVLNDWYCSKRCYGVWLGKKHGFGGYPEHMRFPKKVKNDR